MALGTALSMWCISPPDAGRPIPQLISLTGGRAVIKLLLNGSILWYQKNGCEFSLVGMFFAFWVQCIN